MVASIVLATCSPTDRAEACGFGAGPVAGYVVGEGLSLGWELTGTLCVPIFHAVIGGSYRPNAPNGARALYYLAWEPWLVVGLTAGGAIDTDGNASAVLGAWEAVPFVVAEAREQFRDGSVVPAWVVTLAIGWRFMGSRHEVYVTPKVSYQWLSDPFS